MQDGKPRILQMRIYEVNSSLSEIHRLWYPGIALLRAWCMSGNQSRYELTKIYILQKGMNPYDNSILLRVSMMALFEARLVTMT
jgi:hypothetical protein